MSKTKKGVAMQFFDNLNIKKGFHLTTTKYRKLLNSEKNEKLKMIYIHDYILECEKYFDYRQDRIAEFLYEYITTEKINLDKINIAYCSLYYIDKELSKASNKILPGGVYLAIDENASIDDIYFYIQKQKNGIRKAQEKSRKEWNIKKEAKKSISKNSVRDLIIYELSKKDIAELITNSKIEIKLRYKDQVISSIMEKMGYKVSSDNVRNIISRQKKIQNNL